jgi:hypothetical protein
VTSVLSVFHSFAFYAAACSLTRATAGTPSDVVDLYHGATGAWSTAKLSLGRWSLAATSVGNVAIFAGGLVTKSAQFMNEGGGGGDLVACVSILSCVEYIILVQFILQPPASSCTPAADAVSAVDLYNCATGAWSTAKLSVARNSVAAASVGNLALFVGGVTGGALLCRE